MKKLICGLGLLLAGLIGATANAQNPEFPGYLGVYVVEGYGGMQILDFIPDTPAEGLSFAGEIDTSHTIVRLAGKPTRTLAELQAARTKIPMDQEAKMVLRDDNGDTYHVWISRNAALAMAPAPRGTFGSAEAGERAGGGLKATGPLMRGAPDTFSRGARGAGDEGDFRPKNKGVGSGPDIRSK